ncbi:MAG: flagellin [Planctomycetota bacterium]|nr:flagellin [Planctomycetota bacterium]
MSRINQNVGSMVAQRVLSQQNMDLSRTLNRLSTGLRIVRGSDDPAGLIASENLRAEKVAINAAMSNAERAEQVVNVAEGGLQEISNMLVELQSLVTSTANEAGVSAEEKEANQLQIDSILQSIDRIANSTSFQGIKLLNGNFEYTTTGVNQAEIDDLQINSAKLSNATGSSLNVDVTLVNSATKGSAFLLDDGAGAIDTNGAGQVTFEVTGNAGTQQFTFAEGTAVSDVVDAINSFGDSIGVTASTAGDDVQIDSNGFGSEQFVRVRQLSANGGTNYVSATQGGAAVNDFKDFGVDAEVNINGVSATTNGLQARVSSEGFDVSIMLDAAFAGAGGTGGTSSFSITGGGADFNLGPQVNLANKVSLGIEAVTTGSLGSSGNGTLDSLKAGGLSNVVNGDLSKAQSVVEDAIKQVSGMRGRLGAFQKNTVGSTVNSLSIALENTSAAESVIRDADFAAETANMTRAQILGQAATQALAMANTQPSSVLALLG